MTNRAYVKEIIENKAVLTVKRGCACGGKDVCDVKCFTLQNGIIEITLDNEIGAKPGDFVEIEGKTPAILTYAATVFILPVFIGLLFYFITQAFIKNNITPYIVSVTGFLLSVVFLYFFLNNIIKGKNDIKITKIL